MRGSSAVHAEARGAGFHATTVHVSNEERDEQPSDQPALCQLDSHLGVFTLCVSPRQMLALIPKRLLTPQASSSSSPDAHLAPARAPSSTPLTSPAPSASASLSSPTAPSPRPASPART